MKVKIKSYEDSTKVENHMRVGFEVIRDDGEILYIDRHVEKVDGKSEEDYIDDAYKAKGRNGKIAKDEIDDFEIWEKPNVSIQQQKEEKVEVASAVGKEWDVSKKTFK